MRAVVRAVGRAERVRVRRVSGSIWRSVSVMNTCQCGKLDL